MAAELSMMPGLRLRALAATDGCGPECSDRFGHDPLRHEAYGAQQAQQSLRPSMVRTGILTIDLTRRSIEVDGAQLTPLTVNEWLIVEVLAAARGTVVPYRDIARAVYGPEWLIATPNAASETVRAHLCRLRSRFGMAASLLETVAGRGLRLADVPPGQAHAMPPWSRLRGRWATQHAACRQCGRTDYPHNGRGFCTACGPRSRERDARLLTAGREALR